jgi:hypothetical protein
VPIETVRASDGTHTIVDELLSCHTIQIDNVASWNGSGRDNRECAVFLAGGPDRDFNVLTQSSKELHKASNGEVTGTVPHQQGNLWLLHAEDFGNLDLCHAAVLKDGIDLQGELRLEQLLLRIGKPKVSKDVPAAFGYAGNTIARFLDFCFHFSSAFLDNHARPLQGVV